MNNPKVFLTIFLLLCVALVFLITMSPSHSPSYLTGTVVSQTLTQSLDGHRRFLSVALENDEQILITSPANLDCPEGSIVEFSIEPALIGNKAVYHFNNCLPTQFK